jgi:hypothetical protein
MPRPRLFPLLLLALAGSAHAADASGGGADDASALELADKAPSAVQAPARTWRLYGEAAASRGWFRLPRSNGNGVRGALDFRYDGALADGVRGVLSDRLDVLRDEATDDERHINSLREAYLSWQARPDVNVDLGRVNVRNGAAWGYNPTDYFRNGALRSIVSPDPAALRENRLGTVVVQAQKLWSDSALTALVSPKLSRTPSDAPFSLDLGSTNARNRWLLTASHRFGESFNPQVLLHGGQDTPVQVGANLSGLINKATVGFLEYSGGRGRSLENVARGLPKSEKWRHRAALGVTVTTPFNLSLTVEADYNSAAPDRARWDALRAFDPVASLRLLQAAQDLQELPVRRGAFFYATWRDAFVRRLDLSGFVRQDLVAHSRDQWLELRYHWDQVELALQWQLLSGGPESVYGLVPQRRAIEASLRVFF